MFRAMYGADSISRHNMKILFIVGTKVANTDNAQRENGKSMEHETCVGFKTGCEARWFHRQVTLLKQIAAAECDD